MKTMLEFRDLSLHKYWEVEVDGTDVTVGFGNMGTPRPPKTKTFKTPAAALKSATGKIAKKKGLYYFDASSIDGILASHIHHLQVPSNVEVEAHRAALPHAVDAYFEVYQTGALSIGRFSDFAPGAEAIPGEFAGVIGLYPGKNAEGSLGEALAPYLTLVGQLDGAVVALYNQGVHAGNVGRIPGGPTPAMLEHLTDDPDTTMAAWLEHGLIAPLSDSPFADWVRALLLHHKGAAVEALRDLTEAIAVIEDVVRGDTKGLTGLDLSERGLKMVPPVVGQYTHLETLSLRKNKLDTVPSVLKTLTRLKRLDLYYNRIEYAEFPDWFSELPLVELNLALNEDGDFPEVLCALEHLQKLEIGTVPWLPKGLGRLGTLTHLHVSGIEKGIEANGLGRLGCLRELVIDGASCALPADTGGMTSLETLKFAPNQHHERPPLPASIGALHRLRTLMVGGSTLPPEVCALTSLESLKVSANAGGLPDNLGALTSLRALDLHYARMTSLPASIGHLQNLEILDLEASHLASIPGSFRELANLRSLKLTPVGPLDIGDHLERLTGLEYLAIHWRDLASITGTFAKLTHLKNVRVYSRSGDDLGQRDNLLARLKELPALREAGVPYACKDFFRHALPHVQIQ